MRTSMSANISIIVSAAILATALFIADGSFNKKEQSTVVAPTQSPSQSMRSLGDDFRSQDFRERIKGLRREGKISSSASAARKSVQFEFKTPRAEDAGKLLGVVKSPLGDAQGNFKAFMYFDLENKGHNNVEDIDDPANVLTIHAYPESTRPNYQEHVDRFKDQTDKGYLKGDKLLSLVEVNGATGTGIERGFNSIRGQKSPRPAVVSWWDNGISYSMFGLPGPTGTRLSELLSIARSME